jgi:hypothetical protein
MLVSKYHKRKRWKVAQRLPGGDWHSTYRYANLSSIHHLTQLLYPTISIRLIKAASISLQPLCRVAQIYLALDLMISPHQTNTAHVWSIQSTERRVEAMKNEEEVHSVFRNTSCLPVTITPMAVNLQDTFVNIQNVRLLANHTNYQAV